MVTNQKVIIHYDRIGKPAAHYSEGLVEDDGIRLKTFSVIPAEYIPSWSERWQKAGMIPKDRLIGTVGKYLFYQEYFTILEFRDPNGNLLGHYCDIATPLQKRGDEYYLQDLLLDLWIGADGQVKELDWDEFREAAEQGRISLEQQEIAINTLKSIKERVMEGTFPKTLIE